MPSSSQAGKSVPLDCFKETAGTRASIRGIETQGAFYYDVSDPTENSRRPSQNSKENARSFITNVET